MLRKFAVSILITLVLTIAVYFLFRGWGRSEASWGLIPADASAVLTSEYLQDTSFTPTESIIDFKELPLVNAATEALPLLLWITRDKPVYERTLRNKIITYSFHQRTSGPYGIILYIPLSGEKETSWWSRPNRADTRVLRHTFKEVSITNIHDTHSKPVCSYIIKNGYLIVSPYGELIEDVVRHSQETLPSFSLQEQFENVNDSKYGVNVYLKKTVWQKLLANSLGANASLTHFIDLFPTSQDFHLSPAGNSGVIFSSLGCQKEDNYAFSWLQGQSGKSFKGHSYISQQTAVLFRIVSKDSLEFRNRFLGWHKGYSSPGWDKLSYYLGAQREELLNQIGSEFMLCQLEETNSITDGKLALIEYTDYKKLRPLLHRLARLAATETNVSTDTYQGYDLFSIPIGEFPASLYGPLFIGFPRTFVTYIAPYLVLSNSSQVLRNYISDYENRITWQHSTEMDSVLMSRNNPPQLALVASPRKVKGIGQGITPGSMNSNKVESVVFECFLSQKKVYPRLSILSKKRRTSDKVINRTFLSAEMEWEQENQPFIAIAQSPMEGSTQLLFTDRRNILFRPDPRFESQVPIASLDGPLVDGPYRADFLNIGRQQTILATTHSLYCIDEDDQGVVTPLKMELPSKSPIISFTRIEGGSEGSSRFIITDGDENLFLWEKVNEVPRKINRFKNFSGIQPPVNSLSQLGSRSLIVTQGNGQVYLLKEDGVIRPGFPADMLARVGSGFAWTQNASTAQPELVGVTTLGELVRVDLQGKIRERRQLYRPSASSRFKTLYDDNSLDWLLVRSSDTRVAILDKEGGGLFEIANVVPGASIRYHYFGVDNRFITIQSGGFTTIFDMNGATLGDKPIPSELPVKLSYQTSYYKLFIFGKSAGKYQVWTIKLR